MLLFHSGHIWEVALLIWFVCTTVLNGQKCTSKDLSLKQLLFFNSYGLVVKGKVGGGGQLWWVGCGGVGLRESAGGRWTPVHLTLQPIMVTWRRLVLGMHRYVRR